MADKEEGVVVHQMPCEMVKVSDLVARWLREKHVKRAFCVSGGASLHLIHGLAKEGVPYICPQHEQAAGFAADGSVRAGENAVAIATSGPGATNLLTPIAASYYDSVPVLYITGQVVTFRMTPEGSEVRQTGFQETPIVRMAKPVTKYAVTVMEKEKILYELDKAWHIAHEGRPGPVLVDIPDDIQRQEVGEVERFTPVKTANWMDALDLGANVMDVLYDIRTAKRPVIVYGWGVHLAGAETEARNLALRLGVPVATTWGARDLLPYWEPLNAGGFGTHGTRAANFTIQNADYILCIGARLDTKSTGTPRENFAREAKITMVDVSMAEIEKWPRVEGLVCDAKEFLDIACSAAIASKFPNFSPWVEKVRSWKKKYPAVPPECHEEGEVNPYNFMQILSHCVNERATIVSDTGCALAWAMQALEFSNQRFFHAFNQTPMGYGLPAAIGIASNGRPVTLITGDGSLQMSIAELATVAKHNLPIDIIVLNNRGHGMCRQTERQWLDGHHGTDEKDLAVPDFCAIANAYGIRSDRISKNSEIGHVLRRNNGPRLVEVDIPVDAQIVPQARFGAALEDAEPQIPKEILREEMLVELAA